MQLLHGAVLSGALMLGGAVVADTYYVPDDFETIQAAIEFVSDGDEIVVLPGTYNEAIDLLGKAIWLHSRDGRDVTTIDATGLKQPVSVVTAMSGEGPETILEDFTITGGTGTSTEWEGEEYLAGGGMFIFASSPSVKFCTFVDNHVESLGGGMFLRESASVIEDTIFRQNSAAEYGGGAFALDQNDVTFRRCTFENNVATFDGGGFLGDLSILTFEACTFDSNRAERSIGGLEVYRGAATVTGCAFLENEATLYGGGLGFETATVTVTDSTFERNVALQGGGLAAFSPVKIARCTFASNTATRGGGIYAHEGPVTITNSVFRDNLATRGGGLATYALPDATLVNVLLAGNQADYGGAIYNTDADPLVINSTFSDNTAFEEGGGMYSGTSSFPILRNSILWGDAGEEIVDVGTSTTTAEFCDIQGGMFGKGNIDADPLFVDPDNGDYRLSVESTCTDAGANNAVPQDVFDLDEDGDFAERVPIDLDGNPRFADVEDTEDTGCGSPAVVDMGAYEFEGIPVHPVLVGDVTGDGLVTFDDLLEVLSAWGECVDECCLADVDFDADVGFDDLLLVLSNWS